MRAGLGKKSLVFAKLVDIALSLCVFSTLTVFYWRGTWKIVDHYQFADDLELSSWISFAVGEAIIVALYLTQGFLEKYFGDGASRVLHLFIVWMFNYIFGFGIVNKWRGVWLLIDFYTGISATSALLTIAAATCVLFALRSFTMVLGSPCVVKIDTSEQYFECSTRFRHHAKGSKSLLKFLLDTGLTVVIIHNFVVCYWRGMWTLMDRWLYPDSLAASCHASLIVGHVTMLCAFLVQPIVKKTMAVLEDYAMARVLLEDVFLFIAAFGTVNVWRGVWLMCDVYIFPAQVEISVWITHAVGFGGLLILVNSGTVLVRGCIIDGTRLSNKGTILPIDYVVEFMKNRERQDDKGGEKEMKDIAMTKYLQKEALEKGSEAHVNVAYQPDTGSNAVFTITEQNGNAYKVSIN